MDGSTVLMLLVAALAVLIVLVIIVGLRRGPAAYYIRREALLSPDQAKRMQHLESALGDRFLVLPRTRVAEFVDVKSRFSRRTRNWARNRILDAYFDFVLLDRSGTEAVGILIGDDTDLPRRQRRQRSFTRQVCESLGLPVVTLDAVLASDPEYLKNAVGHQHAPVATPGNPAARQEPTLA